MTKFGISQPVRRVEDVRFLKGEGNYIEDLSLPNQARAVFLRAPVAHAEIRAIDTAMARGAHGVRLVLTATDLEAEGVQPIVSFAVFRFSSQFCVACHTPQIHRKSQLFQLCAGLDNLLHDGSAAK